MARRKDQKDPELIVFGARVRKIRHARGLTQEGLAAAAGVHWTYVGQVERGVTNPTIKKVFKLARGLEVDPAKLLYQLPFDERA